MIRVTVSGDAEHSVLGALASEVVSNLESNDLKVRVLDDIGGRCTQETADVVSFHQRMVGLAKTTATVPIEVVVTRSSSAEEVEIARVLDVVEEMASERIRLAQHFHDLGQLSEAIFHRAGAAAIIGAVERIRALPCQELAERLRTARH